MGQILTHMCMPNFRHLSRVEQVAAYLREGVRDGRWRGQLPGVIRLAAELAVAKNTLVAALRMLEAEQLIVLSEDGRSRHTVAKAASGKRPLRIGILLYEPLDVDSIANLLFIQVHHALENAGFSPFFAAQTQDGLHNDVRRIARHLKTTPADAWVVAYGRRHVLEWFASQASPGIAIFGHRDGVPIASVGPDKAPAFAAAVRQLVGHGHRRIVLLCRKFRRVPEPGRVERAFLAELAAHGLPVSDFNLPDWEETREGFHARLDSLFRVTPPTALILDEVPSFVAAQQFLAGRNLRVPGQVSLVSADFDPSFAWCKPAITHILWRYKPVVRRVVQWARAISKGQVDLVQTLFPAEFITGATIGPVEKG